MVTRDEEAEPHARALAPSALSDGRPRRARNVALIVVAFVVVLGAVTAGVLAIRAYDKSTSIDRSTPQVVTRQFLDASLILNDPDRAALFVCSGTSTSGLLEIIDAPIDSRVVPSWGDMVIHVLGDRATVDVRVVYRLRATGGIQQQAQMLTVHLEEHDGWRVCALTKENSLEP